MHKCAQKLRNWENIEKMCKRTGKIAKFHGKLPISRKTVHFTVRVTAVKSRNRLGPTYEVPGLTVLSTRNGEW